MTTTVLPGRPATRPDRAPVSGDLLGTVRIPATELHAAARAGAHPALLDRFFPPCDAHGTRLGRSAAYYQPRTALPAAAALAGTLSLLGHHVPGQTTHLRHALLDNLHNLTAAGAYALWHHLTDHPAAPGDPRPAALDRLLDTATAAVTALHTAHPHPEPDAVTPADLELLTRLEGGWRSFRELDNHTKMMNELRFLADHVLLPRPDITDLLAPLYGSLSLALTARALLPLLVDRPVRVHLVRLGFHDQSAVPYLGADGTIRHRATAPAPQCEALAAAVTDRTVLVVDDNCGYGSTLRAARTLVEQLGGEAVTRSVESAWSLYHRSGLHDIADAADLPSLRPNLHHSIQKRLIGHLLRGDAHEYARDPAHQAHGTLHQQMRDSFDLALSTGTWSSGQLAAMRAELGHATTWAEPPVPRPAALNVAA
ncbi:phosphoribosyltransferase [Streptomyces sp. NBC_01571]|uniref:phosphoribosyltransferase n=1 Tax=Streptomyces sp. NBC_01571 TaxID=2975883 RepID=UPI0022544AD5|nr:phosphoribosyltransferase [Streptomyces sp. NBC_01571]MCX4581150.1 phosphoribosyltransferase [Streptomyces sp. NBC_01571]